MLEALLSAIRIRSNGSVKALRILGAFQRLRVRELRTPLQLPDQALYAKYYTMDSEGQKITVENSLHTFRVWPRLPGRSS